MYKTCINDVIKTLNPVIFTGILVICTLVFGLCFSKGMVNLYLSRYILLTQNMRPIKWVGSI